MLHRADKVNQKLSGHSNGQAGVEKAKGEGLTEHSECHAYPPVPHPPCYNLLVRPLHSTKSRELLACATDSGTRLDRFVAAHCHELSRTRVQELIDSGHVRINGKP